jgi:hypothetical protein
MGYVVTLIVGLLGGRVEERRRAQSAERERAEVERRTWRRDGAAAIGDATAVLDTVIEDKLRGLPREAQLAAVVAAQRAWREPRSELMRIAAAHPDESVMTAALRLRSTVDDTLDRASYAAALVALAVYPSVDHLRQLVQAVNASPEGPAHAHAGKLREAWGATWTAREEAFAAMEELRTALHHAAAQDR